MFNRIFSLCVVGFFLISRVGFAAETNVSTQADVAIAEVDTGVSSKSGKVYTLSPNDVVQIKVFQEDDLETKSRVARDGSINLPLIGVVKVGGKTVEEATQQIQVMLGKDYLVNPQVTLIILEYSKRRFTILGQVQRPNSYDIPNEETITLLDAIAMAGGYTRIGAPGKITVRRKIGDEEKVFKLDAEAMGKDKKTKPFEILPDDVITVGEKWI